MKNFISKSVILFVLIAFLGCSSDSLIPCTPVICKNGATSNSNCGCDCPKGYTGYDCSLQKQPTKISISKIEIISFPKIDPSAISGQWDYFGINSTQNAPDIAIVLEGKTIKYVNSTTNAFSNAKIGTTYTYTFDNLTVTDVTDIFAIQLRDIDDNTFQIMDTYIFSLYNGKNGFPTVLSLNNGETQYKIYVSYTW